MVFFCLSKTYFCPFQATAITVVIGNKDTGVTICSLNAADAECEWSDAVAFISGLDGTGTALTDTFEITYTPPS